MWRLLKWWLVSCWSHFRCSAEDHDCFLSNYYKFWTCHAQNKEEINFLIFETYTEVMKVFWTIPFPLSNMFLIISSSFLHLLSRIYGLVSSLFCWRFFAWVRCALVVLTVLIKVTELLNPCEVRLGWRGQNEIKPHISSWFLG